MNLSDLPRDRLREELGRGGVAFRTGPFITRLTTPIPQVAEALGQLYDAYPLIPSPGYADFHIAVMPGRGLRRWYRPQVLFLFDGWPPFKPLPYRQAFAVFEWGLNWCVANHAHHYLIVHASVVEKNGCAIMMPAPIGSGKSTLAAAMVLSGWRLLTDELGMVSLDENLLVPLPRPVGLKNRSIDVIRAWSSDAVIGPLCPDTLKGTVAHLRAPDDSVRRADEKVPLSHFIFPKYNAGAGLRFTPCTRADTFMRVAGNSFNYGTLGLRGFQALGRLVEGCSGYDLEYSDLDDAIGVIEALCAENRSGRPRAPIHEQ